MERSSLETSTITSSSLFSCLFPVLSHSHFFSFLVCILFALQSLSQNSMKFQLGARKTSHHTLLYTHTKSPYQWSQTSAQCLSINWYGYVFSCFDLFKNQLRTLSLVQLNFGVTQCSTLQLQLQADKSGCCRANKL